MGNTITNNIGIVIQGPLVTYGQGPNNKPEGFNSMDTILANVKNIKKNGFEYVVSTWTPKNSNESSLLENLFEEGIFVTCNNSPTIFDPDHRYKQHFGILLGMQELGRQKNINYIVKIRTDMLMPDSFWDWIKRISEKNESVLYVSELMNQSFYMGDFIYAAPKDIFVDFINSILKYESKIIHPLIAFDNGVKYCQQKGYFNFQKNRFQKFYLFYLFSIRKKSIKMIWDHFIATNLGVLPEEIWNNIRWRGRRIGSFLTSSNFNFDTSPLSTHRMSSKKNVENLIDGYVRYWEKGDLHHITVATFRTLQKILRTKAITLYRIKNVLSRKFILWNPFIKKQVVLCRSACLGHTISKLKTPDSKRIFLVCQQKTRLDILLEQVSELTPTKLRVKSMVVKKYIPRKDIQGLIRQQEKSPWLKIKKFDYMLIDSFSELTDKKFTSKKEGWSFACHNSDIEHTAEFKQNFESHGLLKLENLSEVYENFFSWFENTHPNKKVIFMHYPTVLDKRTVYKERAAKILEIMKNIEKKKDYVFNIHIDDSKVRPHEDDDFPYHYSRETNREFLEKWKEREAN